MKQGAFAGLYCEKHGIHPSAFTQHVFRRTLYPHARLIAWFIQRVSDDYFMPDLDFVHDVGQITKYREFTAAGMEYGYHPLNRGFLRRVLKIRISTELMQRLVRELIDPKPSPGRGIESDTMDPFKPSPPNGTPDNAPESTKT